jgi:hypothetical protein
MTDMNDKNSAYASRSRSRLDSTRLDMADKNSAYASRSRTRTRHAHGPARPGEASERARACGTPFSFYQLHKWSTIGAPFKLVKILIGFQCGIESLAFILWTF